MRDAGAVALVAATLAAFPAGAPAQEAAAVLDSVEAALDSGRVEGARQALDRWLDRHTESATSEELARARYLRGRAARDPDVAQTEYLLVAMDTDSEYAPLARFRLAQLRLAQERYGRAEKDLELLRDDYPGHALVPRSWLWTGRARQEAGDEEGACRAYGHAASTAGATGDDEVLGRAREAVRACEEGRLAGPGREPGGGAGADRGSGARAGPLTVQIGAFGGREAAEGLRGRARDAGFEARVVGPSPVDGLFRVRVGRFQQPDRAEEAASRLREAGFSALVTEGEPGESAG